jgi:hypothetical protein
MANTNLVIDLITREALEIAHEKISFLGTINKQYDDSFANAGGKIGSTLRIREPNKFTRRSGSRVMDVQDVTTTSQTLTVATQDGVDMRFNSAELSQDIELLSKNYIEPAVSVLVSGIEADILTDITKGIYNQVGTPGTVIGASGDISALGEARAKLNQGLAPKDGNRNVQMASATMASIVNGTKSLFQDSTQIKEAFREGFISRNAMATWYENERVYSHTNGSSDNTGTVNDTVASGDTTVTLASMGVSKTITKGSIITFAGCYDVHPETKTAYSHLKQFVTTADATTDGAEAVTVSVSPAINFSSGTTQNCSAVPTNGGAALISGSASTAYSQSIMYHKDFATFVTADLPLMDDAIRCVRRNKEGLAIRVWQGSDIKNDEMLLRLDILYGWKLLRPEWAERMTN